MPSTQDDLLAAARRWARWRNRWHVRPVDAEQALLAALAACEADNEGEMT